jgi:intracellular sulfur oxidation DsrE/DsrF family protein
MSANDTELARRSFLSRLSRMSTGFAAFGAAFGIGGGIARAQGSVTEAAAWKPARHAEDDWLDRIPGSHRLFFDAITAQGLGQTLLFANNVFNANRTGYRLQQGDQALVICVRHRATALAFTDAMWAKYGEPLAERAELNDPKTKQAPKVNVYMAPGYGAQLSNNGVTLDSLLKLGVHLAVCQMATRANASLVAQRTGAKVDDIYQELISNLVPNSHMVPAGIVAVNHAQERGYAFSYGG